MKKSKEEPTTFQVLVVGLLIAILGRLTGIIMPRENELLDRVSEYLDD